jgi:ribose transport system substrate-binding protein
VCLIGLFAYNPPALVEATRSKKLVGKVKIVGFDEDLVTLDAIDKGEMVGSISQDPYNYGYESVKWLAKLARGEAKKADLPQTPTAHKLLLKAADTPKPAGSTAPVEPAAQFAQKIRDALSKK